MLTANPAWGPPPPDVDLQQVHSQRVLVLGIVLLVISNLTVGLRFFCRRLLRTPLWWDDLLIALALLTLFMFTLISIIWMVPTGLGKHVWVLPPGSLVIMMKAVWIQGVLYAPIHCFVKGSIMALLWRLFGSDGIKPKILVVGGLLVAWGIAFEIITLLQCNPLDGYWQRFNFAHPIKVSCPLSTASVSVAISVFNPIFDVVLIVLPLTHIWRIHMPRAQKLALMGVFALGLIITVASILRICYIANTPGGNSIDIPWNLIESHLFTMVEVHFLVICACLPLLRPIFNLLHYRTMDPTSFPGRDTKPGVFTGYRSTHAKGSVVDGYEDHEDLVRESRAVDNGNGMQTRIEGLSNVPEIELAKLDHDRERGIRVRTDISIANNHHLDSV